MHSGCRQYLITLLQIVLGIEMEKNGIFGKNCILPAQDLHRSPRRVAWLTHSEWAIFIARLASKTTHH